MMINRLVRCCVIVIGTFTGFNSYCQNQVHTFTLQDLIRIGTEQSLSAFRAKNMYQSAYWQFKQFKTQDLPTLDLSTTPISFSRAVNVQYSIQDSMNVIVERQSMNNTLNLSINKKISATGGRIFIDSDVGRFESFSPIPDLSYTSTPIRIGIDQPLFAYNNFKWQKKIEPLQFEMAKMQYIESSERISGEICNLFFGLILSENQLKIAKNNCANSDTLYMMMMKRNELYMVDQLDLYSLKQDLVNSKTQLSTAQNNYERSLFRLLNYFNFPPEMKVKLISPEVVPDIVIDVEEAVDIAQKHSPSFIGFKTRELEAESQVEQLKKNVFTSSLNASYGYNDADSKLLNAYKDLDNQTHVNVSIRIPIIDWGNRKARYNLAEKRLQTTMLSLEQEKLEAEQNVVMTVREFNMQKELIKSAKEAVHISEITFDMIKKRFMIGQGEITNLAMQRNNLISSSNGYIIALQQFWNLYYSVRRITLYDFENNIPLTKNFDLLHGL